MPCHSSDNPEYVTKTYYDKIRAEKKETATIRAVTFLKTPKGKKIAELASQQERAVLSRELDMTRKKAGELWKEKNKWRNQAEKTEKDKKHREKKLSFLEGRHKKVKQKLADAEEQVKELKKEANRAERLDKELNKWKLFYKWKLFWVWVEMHARPATVNYLSTLWAKTQPRARDGPN